MNYPYHPTSKADLRTRIRNQRRALSPAAKDFLDQQLVAHLLKLIDAYSTIAAYVPLPDEPGGDYLVAQLHEKIPHLWLPVCGADFSLAFGRYEGPESLHLGPYGLLEPTATLDSSLLEQLDAIIIPALAIAPTGARLGQGAGFYDRALASYSKPIIGVVYSFELQQFNHEPHDVKCTAIVTEKGTRWCQQQSN